MAVYTKINKKDISSINKKFENQKFLSFKGIKQGIENTNYLLEKLLLKCTLPRKKLNCLEKTQ